MVRRLSTVQGTSMLTFDSPFFLYRTRQNIQPKENQAPPPLKIVALADYEQMTGLGSMSTGPSLLSVLRQGQCGDTVTRQVFDALPENLQLQYLLAVKELTRATSFRELPIARLEDSRLASSRSVFNEDVPVVAFQAADTNKDGVLEPAEFSVMGGELQVEYLKHATHLAEVRSENWATVRLMSGVVLLCAGAVVGSLPTALAGIALSAIEFCRPE
jgi:hypothetical protein